MRTTAGIIHPQLSRVLSEFGHTDGLVVADGGLPIPTEVERVDLAWRPGQPSFSGVLDAVLDEFVVERAVGSAEMADESPEQLESRRGRGGARARAPRRLQIALALGARRRANRRVHPLLERDAVLGGAVLS
jgi:hypothetical protein